MYDTLKYKKQYVRKNNIINKTRRKSDTLLLVVEVPREFNETLHTLHLSLYNNIITSKSSDQRPQRQL